MSRRARVAVALCAGALVFAAADSAETIVRAFFQALDKRDAKAMMALLPSDAGLRRLGDDRPLANGREAFAAYLQSRFREFPNWRTKIAETMANGSWVVSRERVTLEKGERPRETLWAFEVPEGRVRRAWALEASAEGEEGIGGEGPVALQIEKWNAKDLPRLLATYDEGATVVVLATGERLASGEEALRDRFERIFESSPHLRTEVLQRMSLGPWVAYRERTVSGPDDRKTDGIAVYEVRDGLVRRVWLLGAEGAFATPPP